VRRYYFYDLELSLFATKESTMGTVPKELFMEWRCGFKSKLAMYIYPSYSFGPGSS
jgi:hypothetical protein